MVNKLPFRMVIALTLGVLPANGRAQSSGKQPGTPLSAVEQKSELAKLREIFASVGELPPKHSRWVEVQAGAAAQKTWHRGWMLRQSEAEIRLLTEDGSKETFQTKNLPAKQLREKVKWSDAWTVRSGDFAKYCREFMSEKKKEVKDEPGLSGAYRFQRALAQANTAVVDTARLAVWASRTGNERLAGQLLTTALRKLQERRSIYVGLPTSAKLHAFVAGQITPHSEVDLDMLLSGREPGGQEARLRSLEWNKALAHIPFRSDHGAIVQRIKQLESLIAEDKTWKEPTKEELARFDVSQKAAYWLHHLRDLNVTQSSSPGMCRVLVDSPWQSQDLSKKGTPNPAVELKKLGYQALPQIIAHLDDARPTQCIGFWRHYAPDSYYTLAYGDCCQQILEAITNYTIYERLTTNGYPIADGKGKDCKTRAANWLKDFKRKGEKQILIEGTSTGDMDSPGHATRLIEKYPKVAFPAVAEGIKASSDKWARAELVRDLAMLKDERVVGLMLEELKGPVLQARVDAAVALVGRGRAEGFRALVREWSLLQAEDYGWAGFEDDWAVESLVAHLVDTGRLEAFRALGTDLRKRTLYLRWHVLEALAQVEKQGNRKVSPEVAKVIDQVLVTALQDTEKAEGRSFSWKMQEIADAPVGDFAATNLAQRWGRQNAFNPTADFRTRRRQKIALANSWRKSHDQPLLPEPPSLKIEPAPDAKMAPLLKALTKQTDRTRALVLLEKLRLSALPALSRFQKSLPVDSPAAWDVKKLLSRLRNIVQEVSFAPDSIEPTPALRKQFEAWKNKRITPLELMQAVTTNVDSLPPDAFGLHMDLEHPGDDAGVTMVVTLAEKRPLHVRANTKSWAVYERITSAGKTMYQSCFGTQEPIKASERKEFAAALQKVLATPFDQSFSVSFGVAVDRK